MNWNGYILRLTRETSEYQSGSWYNHSWNEVYKIVEYAQETSRGETIRIDNIDNDVIHITFFEWKFNIPMVYFKARKDVSIPQRNEYSFLSVSDGYIEISRFVKTVS